ncbi:hypothetical protein P154DRAFT_442654 [Amniculicola lignicola CBS 123094]|uniref:Uncharacterized protein n=1 Tax=Amniculicola lignicola CBS 123094 TaxID=1392246 RepID=A0A6A5W7R1_9PLEO|nr:hypothetical protein P154DRAFT_442654 [Amniculicola lignicola CBS 123094]
METTTEGNLVASTESGDEEALVRDEVHFFPTYGGLDVDNWEELRDQLPEDWQWDVEYHQIHSDADVPRGSWTCTPMEADVPKNVPLTIGGAPVVIPVEYQWPPLGGAVNPPPDPRPSSPLDCTAKLELDVIRDIFLTFGGSIGMYVLVNGLLQILVPEDFDTTWASSHLPHKYGGLKVCYITQSMDATMIPAKTETKSKAVQTTQTSTMSSIFSQLTGRPTHNVVSQPLQLNDFIEARMKSTLRKEKFAGRIGLRVAKDGESKLLMSSHVITEAILGRSHRPAIFRKEPYEVLERDWNEQVEIWAGNEKVGTIEKTFDPQAELYPEGFVHDLTVIKPLPSAVNILSSITSPIPDLGWLSRETWNCLRRQVTPLKILSDTDINRRSKTLKCAIPSEILVVGEGIFLRQSLPPTKPSRAQPREVWEHFISRALLYRVSPDFDPPDGHSGIALYGEGLREDGTTGPGIAGFQSFVQRSGPVQASFDMPEVPLNHRLKKGRVSFYGSFVVPEEIRKEYRIV